jgi:glycosyltransferase involved in cell wall biosynthesis
MHAAQNLGIELTIFAPGPKQLQILDGINHLYSLKLPTFLNSFKISKINKILFLINSLMIPVLAQTQKGFRCINNIWMRDPLSALVLSVISPQKRILLELHHRPNGVGLKILRKLTRLTNVSFSAISPHLASQIINEIPEIDIFVSPMAVPANFFSMRTTEPAERITKLLYIGKGQSSGFDNGLELLMQDFQRATEVNPDISLTFLGLENYYRDSLSNLQQRLSIPKDKIKFLSHVPHEEVKEVLKVHDIGVLPYPANQYNNERFPIKSLEYAASELLILASRIDAHTEIVGDENAFFYEPGVINSFESVLAQIVSQPDLRRQKLKSAMNWSQSHTYERRIQGVVNKWLDRIV